MTRRFGGTATGAVITNGIARMPNQGACLFCGAWIPLPKEATLLARACPRCRIMPGPEQPERERALRELRMQS